MPSKHRCLCFMACSVMTLFFPPCTQPTFSTALCPSTGDCREVSALNWDTLWINYSCIFACSCQLFACCLLQPHNTCTHWVCFSHCVHCHSHRARNIYTVKQKTNNTHWNIRNRHELFSTAYLGCKCLPVVSFCCCLHWTLSNYFEAPFFLISKISCQKPSQCSLMSPPSRFSLEL